MAIIMLPQLYFYLRDTISVVSYLSVFLGFLLMFFIVNTVKINETRNDILGSKKLLIPFSFVFGLNIVYIYASQYTKLYTKTIVWMSDSLSRIGLHIQNYDYLAFFLLLLSLLSIYAVDIRPKDFNWGISKKEIAGVLMASIGRYLPVILVCLLIFKIDAIRAPQMNPLSFLVVSVRTLLYPAFYEEFIYRGLLFSLLKGYNISFNKINIIQAVIFGFMHFSYMGTQFSILTLVFTGFQIVAGYTLGLLYQRTKSLTPCIILHALIDIYMYFLA
jgi:membrane protease YdiL (CAAX protease family)